MGFLHRHRWLTPYLLLAPGLVWLGVFFLVPLGFLGYQSLEQGDVFGLGYKFTWAWHNFWDAISTYHPQLIRSFEYAGSPPSLALLLSYPLVVLDRVPRRPLEEPAAAVHHRALLRHLPDPDARVGDDPVRRRVRSSASSGTCTCSACSATTVTCSPRPTAVVAGITYNFLPFMALPLYVCARADRPAADRGRPRTSTRASRRRSCG